MHIVKTEVSPLFIESEHIGRVERSQRRNYILTGCVLTLWLFWIALLLAGIFA
jgi:hypothetical protein